MLIQKIAMMFFVALAALPAHAGKESGGGDPLANEFLAVGRHIEESLVERKIPGISEDGAQFKAWLDLIQQSLDGTTPRLSFPAGELVDCFGIPKVGCADAQNETITIARAGFKELSPKDKMLLVTLEIFALMKVSDRYVKAGKVAAFTSQPDRNRWVCTYKNSTGKEFSWLAETGEGPGPARREALKKCQAVKKYASSCRLVKCEISGLPWWW